MAAMPSSSASDHDFDAALAGARRGDPTGWSVLYHDVAPIVLGYLRGQRLEDPEDVAGEVMLEMVRGIERFDGDQRQFRSWVLTIAHHRMIDDRRRTQRRPATTAAEVDLEPHPASDDPAEEAMTVVGLDEYQRHLAMLTDEQRTVLLLRLVGDLPLADVARIMGKRVNAVKALQHRAVGALRRQLEQEPPAAGASSAVTRNPDARRDAR